MSSQSIRMMRVGNRVNWPAFTLVELLVVIGIIALLIAILLPSLQLARRTAQRTACAAKLHQIMIAAQMHRQDHQDYYPLCGVMPGFYPADVDDPYAKKYVYYANAATNNPNATSAQNLVPITFALYSEMAGGQSLNMPGGILNPTNYNADVSNFLDPRGPLRNFLCPSQATSPLDILPMYEYLLIVKGTNGTSGYTCQPQSYIYNEYILGWNFYSGTLTPGNGGFLAGKASLIHQPASTMFAADGVGGSTLANHATLGGLPLPMYTVYPNTANPTTLADAYTSGVFGGLAGDKACFDLKRHGYKINVAFCDGHVESRTITNPNSPSTAPDLANIWIEPP